MTAKDLVTAEYYTQKCWCFWGGRFLYRRRKLVDNLRLCWMRVSSQIAFCTCFLLGSMTSTILLASLYRLPQRTHLCLRILSFSLLHHECFRSVEGIPTELIGTTNWLEWLHCGRIWAFFPNISKPDQSNRLRKGLEGQLLFLPCRRGNNFLCCIGLQRNSTGIPVKEARH